jgi:two-component system, NarL family, invasion response regulator UvrY
MTTRVLVADDQAPFRAAARAVIAAVGGFQLVAEATSGEDAVALVDAVRPDLVLMDITMTGIGGLTAARLIAAAYPDTMTILVSTYRADQLPHGVRACGAAAYLHKSELDGRSLRELWASRSRRDRGSRPSHACAPRSPRRGRA